MKSPAPFRMIVCWMLAWMFTACTTAAGLPDVPAAPTSEAAPASSATTDAVYEVQAWVENPEPAPGERVTISGSLIKNGVYIGGMMMEGWWPEEGHERGMPNCKSLVIYQRGVCAVEAGGYPAGVYVPVTVLFRYNDQVYTGETGFTPR